MVVLGARGYNIVHYSVSVIKLCRKRKPISSIVKVKLLPISLTPTNEILLYTCSIFYSIYNQLHSIGIFSSAERTVIPESKFEVSIDNLLILCYFLILNNITLNHLLRHHDIIEK